VIVQAKQNAGRIYLEATADKLQAASVAINTR